MSELNVSHVHIFRPKCMECVSISVPVCTQVYASAPVCACVYRVCVQVQLCVLVFQGNKGGFDPA